jgi:lysyl-tRNA synthetase class 1
VEKYAPESVKIKLLDDPSIVRDKISERQREALVRAAELLLEKKWGLNELNNKFFELSRSLGLAPPEFFEAAYLALIGRKSGPRLVNFIVAIGKERVAKHFLAAAGKRV